MSSDEHSQRFETALAATKPFEALCDLAIALRGEGVSQIDSYLLYSHFLQEAPADNPSYDAIADTMDFIHGGPWAKGHDLYPTPLTDEIIHAARKRA